MPHPSATVSRLERTTGLLPHEVVFNAFLLITTVRLALAGGEAWPWTLFHGTILGIALGLTVWCWQDPTQMRWRLRLGLYALAIGPLFAQMRHSVPLIHPGKDDALLQSWDSLIFGGNASLAMEGWISDPLTEVMSFCYVLFFPYLVLSIIRALVGPLPRAKRFFSGLFTLYGIGFLGYTLLPALGPYVSLADQFSRPLGGYGLSWLSASLYPAGTNEADVFPSLHVAITVFILAMDWTTNRRRCLVWLPFCVGLWISTLYLRYHYATDVLAGFALAAVALTVVRLDRVSREPGFHGRTAPSEA